MKITLKAIEERCDDVTRACEALQDIIFYSDPDASCKITYPDPDYTPGSEDVIKFEAEAITIDVISGYVDKLKEAISPADEIYFSPSYDGEKQTITVYFKNCYEIIEEDEPSDEDGVSEETYQKFTSNIVNGLFRNNDQED